MTEIARVQGALDSVGERARSLQTVYVYQAPVRLWHWVNALLILALCITGYFIGSPPPSVPGEASASFQMGYIRFIHFACGQTLIVFFLLRFYWAFAGNKYAKQLFYMPITNRTWCRNAAGTRPDVEYAALYDLRGRTFSEYRGPSGRGSPPAHPALDPVHLTERVVMADGHIAVYRPVVFKADTYGTLYLSASTEALAEQIRHYVFTLAGVAVAAITLAIAFAMGLQRVISTPILRVAQVAKRLAEADDYSIRAPKTGGDEIRTLADGFNAMLAALETRMRERDQAEAALRFFGRGQRADVRVPRGQDDAPAAGAPHAADPGRLLRGRCARAGRDHDARGLGRRHSRARGLAGRDRAPLSQAAAVAPALRGHAARPADGAHARVERAAGPGGGGRRPPADAGAAPEARAGSRFPSSFLGELLGRAVAGDL